MSRVVCAVAIVAGLAGLASAVRGDLIDLKDGRHFSGSMAREGDVMVIKTDDGTSISVRPDQVARVTLTSGPAVGTHVVSSVEIAAAEWRRVAMQIDTAGDLPSIIALHQTFLDNFPAAENTADVKAGLKHFQDLAAASAIKLHGEWVERANVDAKLKEWAAAAAPALKLYLDGKMKESLDAARTVLEGNKNNPDALKIAGLSAYRMNDLRAARAFFTTITATDGADVMAENNLAVISFAQKQNPEGLTHYVKALKINPENRLLLDNVVEAIPAYLATSDKNADVVKTIQRLYATAEKKMEGVMAAQGFTRYGSTWIDKAKSDDIVTGQHDLQNHIAQLQKKIGQAQGAVQSLDAQIKQVENDYNMAMNMINAEQVRQANAPRGGGGQGQNDAEQRAENDLNRKTVLEGQRVSAAQLLNDMQVQLVALQKSLKDMQMPTLTGMQQIMDLGEDENPPPPSPPPQLPATAPAAT